MALFPTLLTATVLCSLVAGLLFSFAVIVMPGLGHLEDRDFIRAFQEIDGVIQRGQPLFGLVWLGSALAMVAGAALGFGQLDGAERGLLALSTGIYLLGVQLPTFMVNIRLNNEIQAVDLGAGDEGTWRSARESFEARWNQWNLVRTSLATLTTVLLVALVGRI